MARPRHMGDSYGENEERKHKVVRFNRFVCVIALGAAACAEAPTEWAGRVVDVEGVRRVENPAEPLAASEEVSHLLRWSLSGPEAGG